MNVSTLMKKIILRVVSSTSDFKLGTIKFRGKYMKMKKIKD
jgi:hypothetical protein